MIKKKAYTMVEVGGNGAFLKKIHKIANGK